MPIATAAAVPYHHHHQQQQRHPSPYRRGNFHQYLPEGSGTTGRRAYEQNQQQPSYTISQPHGERLVDEEEEDDRYYQQQQQYAYGDDAYYEEEGSHTFGDDFNGGIPYEQQHQQYDHTNNGHLQDPFAHMPTSSSAKAKQRSHTSRTVSPPLSPRSMMSTASSTGGRSSLPFDQHMDTAAGMRFYEDESESQPGKILPAAQRMQQQQHQQQQQRPWKQSQRDHSPLRMRRGVAPMTVTTTTAPQQASSAVTARRSVSPPAPLRSPIRTGSPRRASPTTTAPTSLTQQYRLASPRISVPMNYPYGVDEENDETDAADPRMTATAAANDSTSRSAAHMPIVSPTPGSPALSAGGLLHPRIIHDDEPSALTMQPMDILTNNGQQPPGRGASEDDDSLFDFDGSRRSLRQDATAAAAAATTTPNATAATPQPPPPPPGMGAKAAVFMAGMGAAAVAAVAGAGLPRGINVNEEDELTYGDDTKTEQDTVQSTYTKSAESEVEDIIKDIFMIGSGHSTKPGRRKVVRNSPPRGANRAVAMAVVDPVDHNDNETDEPTIETNEETTVDDATFGDDTLDRTLDTAQGPEGEFDDDTTKEDYVAQTLEFVGGKLSVAAAAIAWSVKQSMTKPDGNKTSSTPTAASTSRSAHVVSTPQGAAGNATEQMTDTDQEMEDTEDETDDDRVAQRSKTRSASNNHVNGKHAPAGQGQSWDFFQAASDAIFGPEGAGLCEVDENPSLEEDVRLVDLAVQAAVSAHRLNGVEFDPSYEIDIASEIKFSVVDLQLPLGLIFQENEKGCWITKILPEGNAARCNSNIQVGDQLAAVDGASAIDLTVDDIATLIRKKKKVVELTFVRYVGQLRPAVGTDVQEEGYEIQATEALPFQRTRRKKNLGRSESSADPHSELHRLQMRRQQQLTMSGGPTSMTSATSPKGILKNTRDAMMPPMTMMMSEQAPPIDAALSPSTSLPSERSQCSTTSGKKRFRLFGRRK